MAPVCHFPVKWYLLLLIVISDEGAVGLIAFDYFLQVKYVRFDYFFYYFCGCFFVGAVQLHTCILRILFFFGCGYISDVIVYFADTALSLFDRLSKLIQFF